MNTVTSKDGTPIAFDRSGEGSAIILVGGALQHRAIDPARRNWPKPLSPDFTAYHYDRRGRGDSGDTAPYAVGREIEDIEALIEDAGGSALVFGIPPCGPRPGSGRERPCDPEAGDVRAAVHGRQQTSAAAEGLSGTPGRIADVGPPRRCG